MGVKALSVLISSAILFFVIELSRREKLSFKYAIGWIILTSTAIVFALFSDLVYGLAGLFGFELPSNFIFFVVLCGFVFLSLLMTIFLCQQNKRNDRIAQKLGILENELQEMKQQKPDGNRKEP